MSLTAMWPGLLLGHGPGAMTCVGRGFSWAVVDFPVMVNCWALVVVSVACVFDVAWRQCGGGEVLAVNRPLVEWAVDGGGPVSSEVEFGVVGGGGQVWCLHAKAVVLDVRLLAVLSYSINFYLILITLLLRQDVQMGMISSLTIPVNMKSNRSTNHSLLSLDFKGVAECGKCTNTPYFFLMDLVDLPPSHSYYISPGLYLSPTSAPASVSTENSQTFK
ncbi:uncharacterized protein LACBIDRAFT_330494 [Laccaria bicolor S238N-H82]|uniref:Predicted protein n=1 Tax=Laccaria bicolor (strain S238N-H82 / ATCC MYA-4686) TaxID=486041 RepID=B0DLG5_LACBS|nr:uncharacterized protein LACBIDRAFT_330494 [Laccaria bicolor S238N-H82]EDR04562.1 predicted protein [Laccaria bicolor S238N-H82]|eukprot:XP_001884734.1 predicted protein [Laccaria bicolor S238N-H82]